MPAPGQLLLDLTSPLPPLDEQDLRQWARGRTVMISSTMRDLGPERQVIAAMIERIGATPRFFERFSAPGDPGQVYNPEVARADVYLLLAGERYGEPLVSDAARRSATHVEYDTAYAAYKPVLAYNKTGVDREEGMKALVSRLESRHTVTRFQDLPQLEAAVREGLLRLAEAQSTTWVKLGNTVFPVAEVDLPPSPQSVSYGRPAAQVMTLKASLRNPQVRAALNASERSQPLTLVREVYEADDVRPHETRVGQYDLRQTIQISAQAARTHLLQVIPISNGESGEEQLEIAMNSLLLGVTPARSAQAGFHSFARALRPVGPQLRELYGQLAAHQRDAELFVPMAELLLTDRLLRGTDADPAPLTQLEHLTVSPVVGSRCYVRVEGVHVGTSFGGTFRTVKEGLIDFQEPVPPGISGW